eukprot:TRINITY_DN21103_c0_g1_i1.p1 TRINITY_DN21103_c0_g1~~TRINITY_DN21103_c0_g1_i1.p1  ORF type:complete len:129 (-),score=8.46 TRINITY_DN21103_c0_g1_i1:960-1346(-)
MVHDRQIRIALSCVQAPVTALSTWQLRRPLATSRLQRAFTHHEPQKVPGGVNVYALELARHVLAALIRVQAQVPQAPPLSRLREGGASGMCIIGRQQRSSEASPHVEPQRRSKTGLWHLLEAVLCFLS